MYGTDVLWLESSLSLHPAASRAALGWSLSAYWSLAAIPVASSVGVRHLTERRRRDAFPSSAEPPSPRDALDAPLHHGIVLASMAALGAMALGWSGWDDLVAWMAPGASGTDVATAYLAARCLGLLPLGVFFAFDAALDVLERRGITIVASLLAVGLNLILTPVMIAGLGPLPPMGAAGAGLATALATSAGCFGVVLFAGRRLEVLPIQRFRLERLDARVALRSLKASLPSGLVAASAAATGVACLGATLSWESKGWLVASHAIDLSSFGIPAAATPAIEGPGMALLEWWPVALLRHAPPVETAAMVVVLEVVGLATLLGVALGRGATSLGRAPSDSRVAWGLDLRRALIVGFVACGGAAGIGVVYPHLLLEWWIASPLVVDYVQPNVQMALFLSPLVVLVVVSNRMGPCVSRRYSGIATELACRGLALLGGTWLVTRATLPPVRALVPAGGFYLVLLASAQVVAHERGDGTSETSEKGTP
jgi:hypothetical protein